MKRWILPVAAACIPGILLWQSDVAAQAVKSGLALCGQSVIPSLFPFLVAVRFAIGCGLGTLLPGSAAALLCGALGGYPLGAATTAQLYRSARLTRAQAQRLLCCCNLAGPAFVLRLVGAEVFGSLRTGLFLWGIQLLSAAVLTLFLLPRGLRCAPSLPQSSSPASALVEAVTGGARTMLELCGFVVLFSVVAALLNRGGLSSPLLLGAVELTCGVVRLPDTAAGFVIAAALLGWGGISVHCQTAAVLAETDLSMRPYLLAKLLQGLLSAALAWLVIRWFET